MVPAVIKKMRLDTTEPNEDLTQIALTACFGAMKSYSTSKGSIFNYFWSVSKNAIINYLRKKENQPVDQLPEGWTVPDEVEDPFELAETRLEFERLIRKSRAYKRYPLECQLLLDNYKDLGSLNKIAHLAPCKRQWGNFRSMLKKDQELQRFYHEQ